MLHFNGGVSLDSNNANLEISLTTGVTLAPGDTFDIMNYLFNSGLTGGFADAPNKGFVADGWNWIINYDGGEGENEVVLTALSRVDVTATPESGTLVLLGTGLLGLGWYILRTKVLSAR